ncbi:MAG: cytochrome b562 [Planctomycetota bacterium]
MRSFTSFRFVAASLTLVLATSAIGLAWIATPSNPASEALKGAMHQMDESLKVLGKGVTAENRAASLEELAKFETAVMTAKAQSPDSAAKVDEKKRPAFVTDFKKTLVEAMQFALTAEIAILDGKYKEADTVIRNKLGGMKSTGHGKFKTD